MKLAEEQNSEGLSRKRIDNRRIIEVTNWFLDSGSWITKTRRADEAVTGIDRIIYNCVPLMK